MTEIVKKATANMPDILFNSDSGQLSISGKSYPENVLESYKDLIQAIEQYANNPKKTTTVDFDWLYYNTATSKLILKLLTLLDNKKTQLTVNWKINDGFHLMEEKASLIADILNIDIKINRK